MHNKAPDTRHGSPLGLLSVLGSRLLGLGNSNLPCRDRKHACNRREELYMVYTAAAAVMQSPSCSHS